MKESQSKKDSKLAARHIKLTFFLNTETRGHSFNFSPRTMLFNHLTFVLFLFPILSLCQNQYSFNLKNDGRIAYVFDVLGYNPNISLSRNSIVVFNVTAEYHPLWIKTIQGTGINNNNIEYIVYILYILYILSSFE
jgi:hypothetical protein